MPVSPRLLRMLLLVSLTVLPSVLGPSRALASAGLRFGGNPPHTFLSSPTSWKGYVRSRLGRTLRPLADAPALWSGVSNGVPATGKDQPGEDCNGNSSTTQTMTPFSGTSFVDAHASPTRFDYWDYRYEDKMQHPQDAGYYWLEATLDLTPMTQGQFSVGLSDPTFPFVSAAWLVYTQSDQSWGWQSSSNGYTRLAYQPGSKVEVAIYGDPCTNASHMYLGTSPGVLTEVASGTFSTASGLSWLFGAYGQPWWNVIELNQQGNLKPAVIAHVSNIREGTGIPGDVAVVNWNNSGQNIIGPDYGGTPGLMEVNSPSEHSSTCNTTAPVNCATGAFWHRFGDLAVPGRGLPLNFVHTYDSRLAAQDSPLGFGWTHSYNLFLSTGASGAVSVHEENGSAVTFMPGAGGYSAPRRVLASLVANADGTLTFTRHDQTQYVFTAPTVSAAGQLLREVDRNGYTTALSYSGGRLATVTDPAGRTLSLAYNADNRIATVTDPANRVVRFAYDSSGNLTGYTDATGGQWYLTYDGSHRLLTMEDPAEYASHGAVASGPVTSNVYDANGRVTQQTDPMGRTLTFAYTANSDGTQTTTLTDPKGNVTSELYFENKLIQITRGAGTPQAATTQYTYDPGGTLGIASTTDPAGHLWQATWDTSGNLLTTTDPQNDTTIATYDAGNNLTSETDANGVVTTLWYDANGNLVSVARPLQSTGQTAQTTLVYGDPAHPGDVTRVTDANGHSTAFGYDAAGNQTSVTDALGNTTIDQYERIGRVTAETTPRGVATKNPRLSAAYTTAVAYDGAGDVTGVTDGLGNHSTYQYDLNGNLIRSTDARGNSTVYSYDPDGELITVAKPDGSSLSGVYDADGNLLFQSMLAPNGSLLRTLGYGYDPLNRVITSTDPNNRTTTYGYDANGNLHTVLDATARTTTYGYNTLDQLTSIAYNDPASGGSAGTPDVSFGYTPVGLRQSMTDGTGTTTYSYDSLNRLSQTTNGAGQAVGYSYDLGGNLTGLTYPGVSGGQPVTVQRTYDAADQLTDVTDWSGNDTHFSYDADGNLTRERYPASTNGTQARFTYDTTDQLTKIVTSRTAGASPFRWTFGYGRDQLGQVSATTDRAAGVRHSYSYDPLNRLTSDTRSTRTATTWSYDGADNLRMIQDTATGATTTYGYDTNNDELTSMQTNGSSPSNLAFAYNPNGDRTSTTDQIANRTLASYGYNQADELTSLSQGSVSATYQYDGDGLRTSKTVNGQTEGYVWDEAEGLPVILQDGSTRYITGPGGLAIEQVDTSGNAQYYIQDQLGSTRGLIDASGAMVGTDTYGAYGNLLGHGGSASTPFGYAGQYTDHESGLQYLRARYYDPSTEEFLTVDPLEYVTGEPYGYAGGNPIGSLDPTGLCEAGPISVPVGGAGNCSDDLGTMAFASISAILNSAAEPAYSTASTAETNCLAQQAAAAGTGSRADTYTALALSLAPAGGEAEAVDAGVTVLLAKAPAFIVHPDGGIAPVPEGATGPFPTTRPGFEYNYGSGGGRGLHPNVTRVRFMEPTPPGAAHPYPKGRVIYMNRSNQTVHPYTGMTIGRKDPWSHIPWP